MIIKQQKNRKQAEVVKPDHIQADAPVKKKYVAYDGTTVTINPELDRFSGDEYMPEKHKEDEIRLSNSVLPPFK